MNSIASLIDNLIQNVGFNIFLDELLEKAFDDESVANYMFINGWLFEEETYDKHLLY